MLILHLSVSSVFILFFFQAEDGIRDFHVTGVQTCALPILGIFAEICRNLLPAGVVNIVSGYGVPVGDKIARHPDVRRIGFTGSIETGLAIRSEERRVGKECRARRSPYDERTETAGSKAGQT